MKDGTRVRVAHQSAVAVVVVMAWLASASCGVTPPVQVGTQEGLFDQTDAALADVTEAAVLGHCPTTECPAGRDSCGLGFPCTTDLLTDPANCGGCGKACPGLLRGYGSSCVGGKCVAACKPGLGDCNSNIDDGCEINLDSDPVNCGACGARCAAGTVCTAGACVCQGAGCPCPAPSVLCGTECVDLKTDNDHCGSCLTACDGKPEPPPAWHALRVCGNGVCGVLVCNGFWQDCNGDLQSLSGNGCETHAGTACKCNDATETLCKTNVGTTVESGFCFNLDNNAEHCGACFHSCPGITLAAGRPTCQQGVCAFECVSGFANCDGRIENQCEVNLTIDPNNCGACGVQCPLVGQACIEGRCRTKPCEKELPR